ncbi:hypothetical protein VOLCADRAFT_91985 [Volvox carteri f. nagariensis]|uniref:Auxin efflux carrier component n=1 Tax=Volvox carteri f. nagariensis TaxID=3068 RepID=D8TYG5_VOLCA|nr:uncharacterized protein VOLCADRAFT_91985 [Volvox carteri f. nagariensis]EFJ47638.1 hypothetical protein VOLCADRAFT_91985 [Volvox carteri f. nagariensis]|eukprot:XP_002951462.1 hypothetical protein VOLCADRAFT_91985 [Volvox carteri f. nagariensis]
MGAWAFQGVLNVGVQIVLIVFSGWCFARFGLLTADQFMGQINVLLLRVAFPMLNIYLLVSGGLCDVGQLGTVGDAGLLNLVLTANNTVIVGLPVMEATFPRMGGRLSLLTAFVLFLQVIPFSITAFEVEKWMVEDHRRRAAAADTVSEPPSTPDRELSGRWVAEEPRCGDGGGGGGAMEAYNDGGGGESGSSSGAEPPTPRAADAAAAAGRGPGGRARHRRDSSKSSGAGGSTAGSIVSGGGGGHATRLLRGRLGRRRVGSGVVVGTIGHGWAPGSTPLDTPTPSREASTRRRADAGGRQPAAPPPLAAVLMPTPGPVSLASLDRAASAPCPSGIGGGGGGGTVAASGVNTGLLGGTRKEYGKSPMDSACSAAAAAAVDVSAITHAKHLDIGAPSIIISPSADSGAVDSPAMTSASPFVCRTHRAAAAAAAATESSASLMETPSPAPPPPPPPPSAFISGPLCTSVTTSPLVAFPSTSTAAMTGPATAAAAAIAVPIAGDSSRSRRCRAAAGLLPDGRASADYCCGSAATAPTIGGFGALDGRPTGHGPAAVPKNVVGASAAIQRQSLPAHWPPASDLDGAAPPPLAPPAEPSPPLSNRLLSPVAVACPDLPVPQAISLARMTSSALTVVARPDARASLNGSKPCRTTYDNVVLVGNGGGAANGCEDGSTRPSAGRVPPVAAAAPSSSATVSMSLARPVSAAAPAGPGPLPPPAAEDAAAAAAPPPPLPGRALVRAAAGSMTRRHGGIIPALGRWCKMRLASYSRAWSITWVILKNPLLWSLLVALLINLSGLRSVLWPGSPHYRPELGWVAGALSWTSGITVPVSLFSNGVWLYGKTFGRATLMQAGGLLLVKLVVLGPMQLACAAACGMEAAAAMSLLLLALCPVASTSFVIASQYGHGADVVTAITMLGIALLVPVVLVALALPRTFGLYDYQVTTAVAVAAAASSA